MMMNILLFLKKSDFAPGIPKRENFGDPLALLSHPENILVIQHHKARKAGPHLDIRIGNPIAELISWATKKELPVPGGKPIALYQQPLHRFSYGSFEGELPEGYGKGTVKLLTYEPIQIHDVSNNEIFFSVESGKGIDRYKIKKIHGKDGSPKWLLINVTPSPELPEKRHYRIITEEKTKEILKQLGQTIASVQPKIDGAMAIILIKDGKLEIFSPRISTVTGRPIFHTERVFGTIPKVNIPEELDGTVLLGELYGVKKDGNKERILTPLEISSILNSRLSVAREKVNKGDLQFRIWVFDVAKMGKKDRVEDWYTKPYTQRKAFISEVIKYLPKNFHAPIEATTEQDATRLLMEIQKRVHPYTSEGVVIFPEVGVPYKFKNVNERDVYITGFTPGEGKYKGKAMGGLTYSLEPGGKTIGVIGTGLSDELREAVFRNPENFIGRIARIKFQEQYPSGAFRMPVLISLHEG